MSDWLPGLAVAGVRALHGLNPATGWIFAVARGVRALLRFATAVALLREAIALIARQTFFNKPGLSKPRKKQLKPHKPMTQKPCQIIKPMSGGLGENPG